MKVLTIDRNMWLRGEGGERSKLLRPSDGKMCCLGFDALARGLSKDDIFDRSGPSAVWMQAPHNHAYNEWQRRVLVIIENAIKVNDCRYLDEPTREAELMPILCSLGWDKVEFIN